MKEDDLFDVNPIVSTTICSIIGIALIGDFTAQEQNTIGNWLMLIAQELITNAASQNLVQTRTNSKSVNINSKKIKSKYYPLIYNIETLKKILKDTNMNSYNDCINLFDKTINRINEEINRFKKN